MSTPGPNPELVNKKYKWYLFDLGYLIKQRALQAIEQRKDLLKETEEYDFQSGRILAFNEIISLMQQQAEGFDIGLAELRLDDVVPDRDLV